MSSDEKELKAEIYNLEKILAEKKGKLFNDRLRSLYPVQLNSAITHNGISCTANTQEWKITYTHSTDQYSSDLYITEDESSSDEPPVALQSTISFGKSGKKYFLKGGVEFNIYRNSTGELRVINPEYDFEIDMDEHRALIHKYSINVDIPEACALSVFQYIADNKWDDAAVINYLSVV